MINNKLLTGSGLVLLNLVTWIIAFILATNNTNNLK